MACSGVTLNYSLVSKVLACTSPSTDTFSFDDGLTPGLQVGTILYYGAGCVTPASDGFYQDPNNGIIIYDVGGGAPGEITYVEYCSDVEYYISNCCSGANWRVNTGGVIPTWNVGDYVGLTLSSPGGINPEDGCYEVITIPDSFSTYNWNYPLDSFNNYGAGDCSTCLAGEGEVCPTPSPTPTITPTQTPTPDPGCKCLYVDSNVELIATGNTTNPSLNGVAIYEYTDCYDNLVSYTATTGHGILYFCTKNGVIDNIAIAQNDGDYGSGTLIPTTAWIPTTPIENDVNASAQVVLNGICGGDPCGPGAPTPTPTVTATQTQTPTNTETPTPTPTVTTTNTETPTNTPTITSTPTNSQTPTNTVTNTPTNTNTETPTLTPTNTETPTVTPTNTPTNTPTPSITPSDEPFDIYSFKDCCNPDTKFRFSNVTGTLIVGQIFYIGGSGDFDGCAEVIPYESSGPVYDGNGVSFTEQSTCGDMLCPVCPTPTPSPIVICPCKDYNVANTNALGVYVGYVDCIGTDREIYIAPAQTIQLCACLDSVIGPTGVVITLQGDCPPITETPASTPTQTPTPSPTPSLCSVDEYCLLTYYPETEIYDGTYYSAGTYNGRTYYTGDTAYIYYTGSTWCLSSVLGGECVIVGKTCTGPCPNFSEDFFTSGTCVTTTTTVNPCVVFDFEAYFDCDVSTTTTTTIPCSATSVDVSFSAYTTTTTTADPCIGVGGVITISGYTTTTTTSSTTTTTTTSRDVVVSGDVTYTLVETIFVCPGQTYQFQNCDTETNYYVEPSTNFVSVDLFTNYAYLMTINGVESCYTFIGVSTTSPNATVSNIDSWYGECTTCQNNI